MKIPGLDHPITIASTPERLRISAGDVQIADTTHALTLKEAGYPAVHYIPRADVSMEFLEKTARSTHCPYKGDASYYRIKAGGRTLHDAVWSYESPFPAVKPIAGYLAFYPDKVSIERVS